MRFQNFLLGLVLVVAIGGRGKADIIFYTGGGPLQPAENITLQSALPGTTLFGTSNQTANLLAFTSTAELTIGGSGQSTVLAANPNSPFGDLSISVVQGSFSQLELNVSMQGDAFVNVDVFGTTNSLLATQQYFFRAKGNNFFSLESTANGSSSFNSGVLQPKFGRVTLTALNGANFTGISHVRITAVPEPSSLFGLPIFLAVSLFNRRSRCRTWKPD